tara:strand:- start:6943 stop:7893 length:951 start_codon:yes stop_codon:yes gene_type:complete
MFMTVRVCCAFLLVVGLYGCEARLNMERVAENNRQPVQRTDQLMAVAANDEVVVAVGNFGVVLVRPRASADSWQRLALGRDANLIDIEVCPDQRFYALSNNRQLWVSDAKGEHWRPVPIPTLESLLTLDCAPDNTLWVGGSFSTLLSSLDGGASWEEQSLGEDAIFTQIDFVSTSDAYAVAELGLVYHTSDGGLSWQSAGLIDDDFYPQGALFETSGEGWVAGLGGSILHTRDGGQHWVAEPTGVAAPVYALQQVGNEMMALGESGLLLRRSGEQWHTVSGVGHGAYFRDAVLAGEQLILVGGSGGLVAVARNQLR